MYYQNDIAGEDDKTVDILWECGSQLVKYNMSHRMHRHHQEDVRVYHACDQSVAGWEWRHLSDRVDHSVW